MKSNNLLAGNGKRVLVRNTRLHLIANPPAPPPPYCVVLFLFPIHLLILLPNSCIVVSRVSFIVSSLGTPHWETHCWRLSLYVKRCSLWLYFFIQTIFRLFHCIIKWSRGGARDVDSPIRMYRYVFKKISWNIEIRSEVLLSYKSFVTSSDA